MKYDFETNINMVVEYARQKVAAVRIILSGAYVDV